MLHIYLWSRVSLSLYPSPARLSVHVPVDVSACLGLWLWLWLCSCVARGGWLHLSVCCMTSNLTLRNWVPWRRVSCPWPHPPAAGTASVCFCFFVCPCTHLLICPSHLSVCLRLPAVASAQAHEAAAVCTVGAPGKAAMLQDRMALPATSIVVRAPGAAAFATQLQVRPRRLPHSCRYNRGVCRRYNRGTDRRNDEDDADLCLAWQAALEALPGKKAHSPPDLWCAAGTFVCPPSAAFVG